MDLGFAPDSKLAVGVPAQRLHHHPACPQSLPRPGCRSWVVTKKAASSKSNRRQQLQLHCQASEENEPETDADGSAGRSFWDGFRAEQPKEHFMPEQSKLIGKEVYLLVLQQNIDQQVQRALNMDNFDLAKVLREDRQELDADMADLEARKGRGSGAGSSSRNSGADTASRGLMLRSELQQAIEQERYQDAARLRDELKELQASVDSQKAEEESWRQELPQDRRFRLGQRVIHHRGFQAAIVGWDLCCCEDAQWQAAVHDCKSERGAKQPFYHILLDITTLGASNRQDLQAAGLTNFTAYVPEDALSAPSGESSWLDQEGDGSLQHPWARLLFYGQDAQGDMVPTQRLRDRYSQQRRDVYGKDEPEDGPGSDRDDTPDVPPSFPGGFSASGPDFPDSNFPSGGSSFTP